MTLDELLKKTRTRLRDVAKGKLWSDEEIVDWLNEAQEVFVRETHAFVDDDRTIDLSDGDDVVPLDDDIAYVNNVKLQGYVGALGTATEGRVPVADFKSRPTHFVLNRKSSSIRFWPTSDGAYTAILNIARYPASLSLDSIDDELELDPRWQLVLTDGAMARCLQDNDVDGINEASADKAELRFHRKINEAKLFYSRLRMGPNARVSGDRVK